MNSPRRLLLVGVSVLTLAATFLVSVGCRPKARPAPFTAQLTEIPGVQAVYTLRHPKLILGDLDKLMAAVPEAALLRMGFAQLTPYGYPEFSELAAGANLGVAVLEITPEDIAAENFTFTFVGFAKLKEGGKIWTALAQSGLVLEQRDGWTWIAKDAAAFARVKASATITAFIDRPQAEELRVWGRVSPALLGHFKTQLLAQLESKIADRPEADKKAVSAYVDLTWSYLAQLHSAGGSLDFNDTGITLAYAGQFLPESATGTLLRYGPGPASNIAESVPGDGLMSMGMRFNVQAVTEFMTTLIDTFSAVDYPAVAEPLRLYKQAMMPALKQSDGSGVATLSMAFPAGVSQPPVVDMLGVYGGAFKFTEVRQSQRNSAEMSQKMVNAMFTGLSAFNSQTPLPSMDSVLKENALVIDGVTFDAVTTTTTTPTPGDEPKAVTTTQYYGVVGGNLVIALGEAGLRSKLPALVAKRAVPDAVKLAFGKDDVFVTSLHGEKIVELVADSVALDRADADVTAQLQTLRQGYATAGSVTASVAASQAQATLTVSIPYAFIAQSVRLGQFASAHKGKSAPRPAPAVSPAAALPGAQ